MVKRRRALVINLEIYIACRLLIVETCPVVFQPDLLSPVDQEAKRTK